MNHYPQNKQLNMIQRLPVSAFSLVLFTFLLLFGSRVTAQIAFAENGVHCICGTGATGAITLIANGTAGPFTFRWSGPEGYESTVQSPTDITIPGTYAVAVTNAYGCAVTLTTEVGECPVIDPLLLTPVPACTGANNGAITLTPITTGTAPYTYAWSTGATTESINGLAPGEYCLTVTDANGCTEEACATITSGQALDLDAQITNVCGAEHNGSIMLTVSGGSGVYGYRWHDENIDTMYEATRSNLAPGIYNVTVNDEADCAITGSFEIIAHTPPAIASAQVTLATCATAGDGAIALTVSGGAAPYTYAWSHSASTTASIQNLNGAEYCVTVTDANNCPVTACYSTLPTTPQDAAPYVKRVRLFAVPVNGDPETKIYDGEWVTTAAGCIFFTGGTLEISQPLMTAIVAGQRTLKIEAETSEPMTDMLVGGHFFSSDNMQLLSPVIWTTTIPQNAFADAVTNNNTLLEEFTFFGTDLSGNPLFNLHTTNQSQTSCVDIPQLQPNCSWEPALNSNLGQVHVLERKCLQVNFEMWVDIGRINATATGGTGPYTYVWTNATTGAFVGTTQMVGGLAPGRYCVKITDEAGCSLEECVTLCVSLNELIAIDEAFDIYPPCPGMADGMICIPPDAFQGYPVVYQWQDGSSEACISGLSQGLDYCVTVTELVCMQPVSDCVIKLGAVGPVSVALSSSQPACPNGGTNGRLQVTASGGRAPYTYAWNNGTTGAINAGLSAGACHSVTVTDACGQTAVQCFNLPNYAAVAINGSTITPTSCVNGMNGRIQLSLSGGVTPMTFQWANTDGSIPQPPIPSASLNNIETGTYWVTVTDACESPTSGGPFVVGTNYTPMAISGNNISAACGTAATGSIIFTRTGGRAPFDFNWSGPNGVMPPTDIPMLNNLLPGNYSVTITDACDETLIQSFTVGTTSASTSIQVNETAITHICEPGGTGAIDLSASTSSGTLTFNWSNGDITEDVSGLSAGNHSVTISNGDCALTRNFHIQGAPQWSVVGNTTPAFCKNENGSVNLSVHNQGFVFGLSFLWNTGATTEDLSDVEAGTYSVTVTDGFGCTMSTSLTVGEANSQLIINQDYVTGSEFLQTNPPGFLDAEIGAIGISVNGTQPPFSYLWSNGATSQDISLLASGTYTVTVTDETGCLAMRSFFVPVCMGLPMVISLTHPNQLTPLNTPGGGGIRPVVSGGTPSYQFWWTGPGGFTANTKDISGLLEEGFYTLKVIDHCGGEAFFTQKLIGEEQCKDKYKNLYINVQDQCMDTDFVPSEVKFPDSWNGAHTYLTNEVIYVFWTRNGQVVEEGLSAFIESQYTGLTITEPMKTHHISNNLPGVYCFNMIDLEGCETERCKNFGPLGALSGFDHSWIKKGRILLDIDNQFGREFQALTGHMKCQSCRGGAYEYSFPLRDNCNTDEVVNNFQYTPNDVGNPCQGGGMIKFTTFNGQSDVEVIIEVELPEAELATFIQGEECGCLFPPGVIGALETIHPVTGAPFPVYVNIECNPESPPPCNINDPTCTECDIIIDENCVYQGVCLDEDEPFINLPNLGSAVKSCIRKISEPGSYARIRYYCSGDPCNMDFWGDSFSFTTEEELNDYLEVHPTDACQECPQAFQGPPTNNQSLLSSEVAPIIDRNEGLKAIEEKDLQFKGFHTSVFPNPFASDFSVRIKRLKGGKTSFTLIDLTGKWLQSENVETIDEEEQVFPFKMALDLPSGMYQLLIETDQGHRSIHRIVHLKE